MATPAQLRANQLNALKSTGPRSADGKAAARFNAMKHGMDALSLVIPGEDPAELETLARDYHSQFQPFGPLEAHLVETLVQCDWQRRRFARVEAQLITVLLAADAASENPSPAPLGAIYSYDAQGSNALQKLHRRQETVQRNWFRALNELRSLQQERQEQESDALFEEALSSRIAPPPTGFPQPAAIGFVPATRPLRDLSRRDPNLI